MRLPEGDSKEKPPHLVALAAAEEPERRPSKREHDVADVLALLEEHPETASPALRDRLHRIRTSILGGA